MQKKVRELLPNGVQTLTIAKVVIETPNLDMGDDVEIIIGKQLGIKYGILDSLLVSNAICVLYANYKRVIFVISHCSVPSPGGQIYVSTS